MYKLTKGLIKLNNLYIYKTVKSLALYISEEKKKSIYSFKVSYKSDLKHPKRGFKKHKYLKL